MSEESATKHGPISVVILDLDNTLWDWVDLWYRSFRAMLDRLIQESGIPEDRLVPEIKKIHEKYGTSEYAFLIQEIPCLQQKHPGEDLATVYDGAIKAYREERGRALAVYPGVNETLETIKDSGALIVGFTDSRAFYTASRMRKLGIDRILDYLYSPPDHELPSGKTPEEFRMYGKAHYTLRRTEHRTIPEDERKPNPAILKQIMTEVGATPDQVIYVGDSLMKDVMMAKDAGVLDAWAKYGVAQQRPEYELLRRVTHWTANAVQKERELNEGEVNPAIVLATGLNDLLGQCRFVPFRAAPSEREKLVVTIWSKTVDVQQHFNDLELRIRNYAVTLLVAIVGASAFSMKENLRLSVGGVDLAVAATLLVAGAFAWLAFYLMDRFWYHRLLYGAVRHGVAIEKRWEKQLPELRLTGVIGDESPVTVFGRTLRTKGKIDLFYLSVFGLTLFMAGAVQWGTNAGSATGGRPKPEVIPIRRCRPTVLQPTPEDRGSTATISSPPASTPQPKGRATRPLPNTADETRRRS